MKTHRFRIEGRLRGTDRAFWVTVCSPEGVEMPRLTILFGFQIFTRELTGLQGWTFKASNFEIGQILPIDRERLEKVEVVDIVEDKTTTPPRPSLFKRFNIS